MNILEQIKKEGKATFECNDIEQVIKILKLFDMNKQRVTISYHKIVMEKIN